MGDDRYKGCHEQFAALPSPVLGVTEVTKRTLLAASHPITIRMFPLAPQIIVTVF